jgi:hypothetical protein
VRSDVGQKKGELAMTVTSTSPCASSIWPRGVRLRVYDETLCLIDESRDRRYDLHDNIFQVWPENHRRVYLGIEVNSVNWPIWDEKSLKWIEEMIVADFRFDGGVARLRQHTRKLRGPCSTEFIWRVDIRDADGED